MPRWQVLVRRLNRNINIADWPSEIEGANVDQVVTVYIVLLQRVLHPFTRTIPLKDAYQCRPLVQGNGP